ncbi:MAG: DUF624 domain-containing protein [Eubacteriales bacterium]|nr:DUF624 domain-containing protein [Eubacteriales bacterium]
MREVIAPEGPIMQFFAKILDMAIVSVIFTITSIPVITMGCTLTSLYYAVVKAVCRGEGHIVKAYFHCFKVNLKQGLAWGIVCDILVGVLLGSLYMVFAMDLGMAGVMFGAIFVAMLIVMLVLITYGFPVLSRFEVTLGGLLQTSVQMSVTHISVTVRMVVMEGMLLWGMVAAFIMFPPLVVIWPGLITYAQTKVLEPVLQEYMPKEGGEHETEII